MTISFRVYGIPQTKGSAKAYMRKGMKYPVVTNDNVKNKWWAESVRAVAQLTRAAMRMSLEDKASVSLRLLFVMPKPKRLKAGSPMVKRPDLDKMTRSVKDSLEGVFYKNDSQVNNAMLSKVYGDEPGVIVEVTI